MFPPAKQYCCLSRNPTQSNRSAFYSGLKEYGRLTALCGLMSPEPATVSNLPIPTIVDIIYSEEFLKIQGSQQQIDCLVRQGKDFRWIHLKIRNITIGQRNNPSWHLARRGRLTGSNFGCISNAKRETQSLLKCLLGEYDLFGVNGLQWVVNNEQGELKAFTVLTGKTVQETGIQKIDKLTLFSEHDINSKADKPVAFIPRSNWNLECWFLWRKENREPGEKPSEQGQEPTTNSTHMWCWVQESNLGHSGGRQVLSPLHHPCILDASGIFWASPDGIVDNETVLEATCPYTERNLTIEEAIATSPTFCLKKA